MAWKLISEANCPHQPISHVPRITDGRGVSPFPLGCDLQNSAGIEGWAQNHPFPIEIINLIILPPHKLSVTMSYFIQAAITKHRRLILIDWAA